MTVENRRPLATRSAGWAKALAKGLASAGLTPNAISVIGIFFAAAGGWAFIAAPNGSPWLWLGAGLGIQLRLLANMLDGLVAVEQGKGSATGPLYNEFPDRIEDALLLIAAGYACGVPELGYGATVLAFGTAYIRALGGSLGFEQDFVGPMAKQHRMFVLTLAAIACFFWPSPVVGSFVLAGPLAMILGLWLIGCGAALTCAIRLHRIADLLRAAKGSFREAGE
ncbi:CDP-alcohol phosphatidyltransferase family protein [Qipengyuania sp. S6317L1]|uniref:CDP-alcohol phosphatidyltransferase family protein n=1 Tax=Qipengyuania sp. S6317L1 TaxID=2926410 RepID=UPI001FF58208|nr:CDP-alcohol phosphatidyltransferase family protein [Qipengyuania sp. S6317L1]MCK0097792.1 CDP-alcohol phosphatidyltransferase family protein [Qipengyuania sp. S6317L1]